MYYIKAFKRFKKIYYQITNHCLLMERGEGMCIGLSKNPLNHEYFLYNLDSQEKFILLDQKGVAVFAKAEDFSMTDPILADYKDSIISLTPRYGFCVDGFHQGKASVTWTLQPDGRYWADEDGFGGTDDEEVNMVAYIDTQGKVVKPFTSDPSLSNLY